MSAITSFVKRHPLLAIVALTLCVTSSAVGATLPTNADPDFAAIDAYVQTQMNELRIPGVALGIVQGDQIVHLKGFGVADPSGRVVTPQTPFLIASTTKSFTALTIFQLVEAGRVELDAPVQRYIPWFRVADLDASSHITVRNLLNMTSGIDPAAGNAVLATSDASDQALENNVRSLSTAALNRPVGTTYDYNNADYATLGLIVQMVSGQSYERYVQDHILIPLHMGNSFVSPVDAQMHSMATGYRMWFGFPVAFDAPYPRGTAPTTFVISSAEDMAHYLIAQLNGGAYAGTSILSAAGIAEMQQPAIREGASETFWGMGWEAGSTNGIPTLKRPGDGLNFQAEVILVPEGRWGIVLLKNAQNAADGIFGAKRIQRIAIGVTSLLTGRQPPEPGSNLFLLILYGVALGATSLVLIGIVRSIAAFRRWRAQPEKRPRGWRAMVRYIGVPLVLNVGWGLFTLIVPTQIVHVPLQGLLLLMPDLGYLLVVSGMVALGWGITRTVLAIWILRQLRTKTAAAAPATA